MLQPIAHIAELWRYPVKSMRGESCFHLAVTSTGIAGDRRFALTSPNAPIGAPLLSSAERAHMLLYQPHTTPTGDIAVQTPDQQIFGIDDPALLRSIEAHLPGHTNLTLLRSATPLTDVRPLALHSLDTTRQLARDLSPAFPAVGNDRRLRSNILLHLLSGQPFDEDTLAGRVLHLGPSVRIRVTERIPRCRMVALDPATSIADRAILTHLARTRNNRAGVYGTVLTPGTLNLGDPVDLAP